MSGLVFYHKLSPINVLTQAVTKQLYTSVGFYFKSNATGEEKTKVITVDLSRGIVHLNIDDIINDPSMVRVALSTFKGSDDSNLRRQLFSVIQNKDISVENYIYNLFGYPVKDSLRSIELFDVQLVNLVLNNMGVFDLIPSNYKNGNIENTDNEYLSSIILSNTHYQQKPIEGSNILSLINKPLSSYLVPNKVFDPLNELPLPPSTSIQRDIKVVENINREMSIIQQIETIKNTLIHTNQRFADILLG